MYQLVLFIHVFIAVIIVGLVLIQQGKGASVGAAFGSGASQTVFGSRGSGSFLFRFTIGLIALFFITSISLNYMSMHAFKQQRAMNLPMMPVKQQRPTSVPSAPLTAPVNTTLPVNASTPVSNPTLPLNKSAPSAPVEVPVKK